MKDWMKESLDLHRKTEEAEKDRERRFTSADLQLHGTMTGRFSYRRLPANIPGLAEALEIDRKLRRQGL